MKNAILKNPGSTSTRRIYSTFSWLTFVYLTCSSFQLIAQERAKEIVDLPENVVSGIQKATSIAPQILPKRVIQTPWPDQKYNFVKSLNPLLAGDINGDGLADFVSMYAGVGDERTETLDDITTKTLVFFGKNTLNVDAEDQLIYGSVFPVGDLNADGMDDAVVFSSGEFQIFTGSEAGLQPTGKTIPSLTINRYLGFVDLDGNGMGDIVSLTTSRTMITYLNPLGSTPTTFTTTFSASTVGGFSPSGYELTAFKRNGAAKHSLYLLLARSSGNWHLLRLSLSTDVSPVYVKEHTFSFANSEFDNLTLSTSAHRMLISVGFFTSKTHEQLLFKGTTSGKIYTLKPLEANNLTTITETSLIRTAPTGSVFPFGDFDGNSVQDLYHVSSSSIITYDSVATSFKTLKVIDLVMETKLERTPNSFIPPAPYIPLNRFGKRDPSEHDAVLVAGSVDDNSKQFALLMSPAGTQVMPSELYKTKNVRRIKMTTNAGDLNGDGLDDYSLLVEENANPRHLEIYFGGSIRTNTPDLVIREDSLWAYVPVFGDVTGDGKIDLIVPFNGPLSKKGFYLYDNLPNSALPTKIWKFTTLFPSTTKNTFVLNVGIVGDNDTDGILDFAFYSRDVGNKVHLFYGGNNLPDQANVILDGQGDHILSIGDYDNDGFDDLVLFSETSIFESSEVGSEVHYGEIRFYFGCLGRVNNFYWRKDWVYFTPPENGPFYYGTYMTPGRFSDTQKTSLMVAPYELYRRSTSATTDPTGAGFLFHISDNEGRTSRVLEGHFMKPHLDHAFQSQLLGELATVPDVNGDGWDDLLVTSGGGRLNYSHAVVFVSNASQNIIAHKGKGYVLKSNNNNVGIGTFHNSIGNYNNKSAIGDFDGDGDKEFLLPQAMETNFMADPLYVFSMNELIATDKEVLADPLELALDPNFPNPFNPSTNIRFSLPTAGKTTLSVYNLLGQKISTLIDKTTAAGSHEVRFDASALSSGMYFYRLEASGQILTRKMTLLK